MRLGAERFSDWVKGRDRRHVCPPVGLSVSMLTGCRASQRLGRRRGTHPSPCPTTALSTNIVGPRAEEAPIGLSLKVISPFPDCEVYNMIRYCQMSRTHNCTLPRRPGVCPRHGIMLPALHFAPVPPPRRLRRIVFTHSGEESFCHHITGHTGRIAVEFRGHLITLLQVEARSSNFHRV